jgi:hypothetical protein
MLAILSQPGDFVKITQDKPFRYVTQLTGWCDTITGMGILKKEFRWGTSNRVRASWVELTTQNLQSIILDPANDLFVDFRLTLISGGPVTIEDIEVNCIQSADAADPYLGWRPAMLVSERGNVSNLTKIENFSFKPYQVNPAIVLLKQLSYTINQLFGHDVMYARAVPMAIGKDVTLHEWTLYDVDDPKCVKVVVPNNEFPDNKILFNPMGLDFEMPFEIQIVKEYYEEIFGIGTGPQKRDIIYFPLTNRIYEIDSTYLFKDFMQREVYWKIALKKYAPKANRYEPQDLRETFDTLTWDSEERFGEEVRLEAVKTTDPQQYDPKIGSVDYDPTRLNIDNNLVISQLKLPNYTNTLSESQYDLRSIYDSKLPVQIPAIEYRANVDFPSTEERSLCMWFKELKPVVAMPRDNVKGYLIKGAVGPETTELSYSITAKRHYAVGTNIKITRFNGLSLYGDIASVTTSPSGSVFTYTLNVKNEIIQYLDTYFTSWASSFTSTGYVAEATNEQILFNGYFAGNGWKVSLFASRYLIFTDSTKEYLNILGTSLVEDYWYAIFVNMSNFYRQLTVDLWVRKWNDQNPQPEQTTDLENIYSNTIMPFNAIDRSAADKYNLLAGNLAITNIRLFDKTETDQVKQSIILNETIVQDAQFGIIIDNAIPRLRLPWIGKTK